MFPVESGRIQADGPHPGERKPTSIAATEDESPGWQGHNPRGGRRRCGVASPGALGGVPPSIARTAPATTRPQHRPHDVAITDRESERRRVQHAARSVLRETCRVRRPEEYATNLPVLDDLRRAPPTTLSDSHESRVSSCPQSASVPAPRPETSGNRRTRAPGPDALGNETHQVHRHSSLKRKSDSSTAYPETNWNTLSDPGPGRKAPCPHRNGAARLTPEPTGLLRVHSSAKRKPFRRDRRAGGRGRNDHPRRVRPSRPSRSRRSCRTTAGGVWSGSRAGGMGGGGAAPPARRAVRDRSRPRTTGRVGIRCCG